MTKKAAAANDDSDNSNHNSNHNSNESSVNLVTAWKAHKLKLEEKEKERMAKYNMPLLGHMDDEEKDELIGQNDDDG